MKKLCLIFFGLLLLGNIPSTAQTWIWGRESIPASGKNGGGDITADHSLTVDKYGNVYAVGFFIDTITFGLYRLIAPDNETDFFLVKYDAYGNVYWAKQGISASSASNSLGYSVVTDAQGNIYVTGCFKDTISIGPDTLSCTLGLNGCNEYLAKYDANGNVLWAKQAITASSTCFGIGRAITLDTAGNIYVAGGFADTLTFGSYTLISTSPNGVPFLVKYSPNGNVIWARQSVPTGYGGGQAWTMAKDGSDNIYIAGFYGGILSFGSFTLPSTEGIFISKYDINGNVIWAKEELSNNYLGHPSISIDGSQKIYISSGFSDTLNAGASKLYSLNPDICLAKFDSSGSVIWAKQGYLLDNNGWGGVAIVSDTVKPGGGYLAITASLSHSLDYKIIFGSDTFSLNSSYKNAEIFLRFDSSGNVNCGTIFSEGNEDDGDALGVDRSGQFIYYGGDLDKGAVFGHDTLIFGGDAPLIAHWHDCGTIEDVNAVRINTMRVFVFPSPSNGKFTIEQEGGANNENVEIFNMLGEKVYSQTLSIHNSTFNIDLSSQSNGVYLYRILSESGELAGKGKFIIQK